MKPYALNSSGHKIDALTKLVDNDSNEILIPSVAELDINSIMICPWCDFESNLFKYITHHIWSKHPEFHQKISTAGQNDMFNCF